MRAIEMYAQGLQKFPTSLDLAYNKSVIHTIGMKQVSGLTDS